MSDAPKQSSTDRSELRQKVELAIQRALLDDEAYGAGCDNQDELEAAASFSATFIANAIDDIGGAAQAKPEPQTLAGMINAVYGDMDASVCVCEIVGRTTCVHHQAEPNRMDKGRALYLSVYESQGGKWEANDCKELWCDKAEDYERRLGISDPAYTAKELSDCEKVNDALKAIIASQFSEIEALRASSVPSTQSDSAATKHSGTYLGYKDQSGNEMHCANAFCPHQDKCRKGCACPVAVSSTQEKSP